MTKIKLTYPQMIFALLSVGVMVTIFLFSCENADDSSQTSGFFTDFIIRLFVKDFDILSPERQDEIYSTVSHLIRKAAHFTVYTSLGFCLSLTVGRHRLISVKSLLVFGGCFIYASSDEIHQYFVPGRACMFTDVLLDTCGGMTGLLISMLAMKIFKQKSQKTP